MKARSVTSAIHDASGRRAVLALGCVLGLAAFALAVRPALGDDALAVERSDTPRTLSGEGSKILLIDGPFGIAWQSQGKIGVSAAPDTGQQQNGGPAILSGPGADGLAKGRMKLNDPKRYRVSITASGPWEVTVTW